MKYSITYSDNLETSILLDKVDEVIFSFTYGANVIKNFIETYPNKQVNVFWMSNKISSYEIDIDNFVNEYKEILDKIIIGVNINDILNSELSILRENNAKFYFTNPATNFNDATLFKDLGACQLVVGGELFFNLPKAKKYGLPLRVELTTSNSYAYPSFDKFDYPSSMWIRPEDIDEYNDYIDVIEFAYIPRSMMEAFLRIFKEEKTWPGEMSLLYPWMTYMEKRVLNRLLNSELTRKRIDCGQACRTPDGKCRLCYRQFDLANPELYIDKK